MCYSVCALRSAEFPTKEAEVTTTVTLTNGRTLDVRGTYEDLRVYLTTGERREVTLTDGRRVTLATALVGAVEEAVETAKRAVGFR